MKVLIAGGFGFVGARVAHALKAAGYVIVLGSRTARPAPAWLNNTEVRAIDWQSRESLRSACAGVDVVVHASGMNAADCAAKPPLALQVNGVGTALLVEAAIAAGAKRFFYFSTAHVYASPLQGEINEEACPRNLHPYASSHLAGEYALMYALASGHIAGSSLRLSNGFGAPMMAESDCWMLVVNDLCRQAVREQRLVLKSSGEQLRDFIPLSTVCEDIVKLLATPAQKLPPILNIGSGESISVLSLARLIQQRCQVTLGFTPELETGARKEAALPLHYRSLHASRLTQAAIDALAEIDALLLFCKTHFSS
jgi:UDP-glucose 4-epimerase